MLKLLIAVSVVLFGVAAAASAGRAAGRQIPATATPTPTVTHRMLGSNASLGLPSTNCATPTASSCPPPPRLMNESKVAVDVVLTDTVLLVTFPHGFQAAPIDACVTSDNVLSCPNPANRYIFIAADPQTSAQDLPAGTWELVSNPFDVPAAAAGADEIWTWDGGAYSQVDRLEPHQAAWAVSYGGGTLNLTALPR